MSQMEIDQQQGAYDRGPDAQMELADGQVINEAGGVSFALDDLKRFCRFLVLGCEGGTYYATQQNLAVENAQALQRLIANGQGQEVVDLIVKYSVEGRTAKQEEIIFAFAMCAKSTDATAKEEAYRNMNKVLRIPTHLFHFVEMCETLSKAKNYSGWGRAHRTAVKNWYNAKRGKELAMHVTKYKQQNSLSHKDVLRLCHIKPTSPEVAFIVKYVIKGFNMIKEDAQKAGVTEEIVRTYKFLEAVEQAKTMDEGELAEAIRKFGLVREHIPTNKLNSKLVWEALLENMPMTAMIRNLGKMTSIGLLDETSDHAEKVCSALKDAKRLSDAKIYPTTVLVALRQYQMGHGDKGKLHWQPNQLIAGALDEAFYLAFKCVEPTNKSYLLALDISSSMTIGSCCGVSSITPRVASSAMAMTTARTEQACEFVAFSHGLTRLNIESTMKLCDVMHVVEMMLVGGTDCALPMLYAMEKNKKVDVFVVYTASETWFGGTTPVEALRRYREHSSIAAKLIVVGMTSNGFTIADPNDAGMLDMVGFDTAAPEIMRQFVVGNI